MARRAPLLEDVRQLGHGQRPGIDGLNDQVMDGPVVELGLFIETDPFILQPAQVGETSDRRMDDPRQVAFDEPRVPASQRYFGGKRVG